IRWYALAYIAGLVIGWRIMRRVCQQPPKLLTPVKVDDFLLWAALGVILGGRLGYVLFYKPAFFLSNPLQIFTLWEGGMSFHGGLLGVIAAILIFALRNAVSPFMLSDLVAIVAPIGEFFREPDSFMGFLLGTGWLTMGMLLSLPVLLFGLGLIVRAQRAPTVAA